MSTTISQDRKVLPRAIAGLGLILALVVGTGVAPAQASTGCPLGTGWAAVTLPFVSEGAYSLFYSRVDGGQWQQTPWYYSNGDSAWVYNSGTWQYLSLVESGATFDVGGGHLVEVYELRYTPSNWGYWVWHGGCTTQSFDQGGLVFTSN